MDTSLAAAPLGYGTSLMGSRAAGRSSLDALSWMSLPLAARIYAAVVIAGGAGLMLTRFPGAPERPVLFGVLLVFSCVTSAWKVTLPLSTGSGSTLSVSYAADLMALLLLGPGEAMVIAAAGVWTQCTFRVRQPYPAYRTIFSVAAEVITIQATGLVYALTTGTAGMSPSPLPRALVAMIAAYFFANTGLVAAAIALSTRQHAWKVWHDNFLWSGPSFMVAGAAGAVAALVVQGGHHWLASLMLAPVYLTYRTYHVFLARIEDQRRHVEETQKLHAETVEALLQARRAEQALADEKERLAVTLRSIGDGVITTDLNGKVMMINNVAESLTGWTQEDAASRPLREVFRNLDPDTREGCDNAMAVLAHPAGHPPVSRCSVLVARDLTEHPIEEVAAPLRDSDGHTIGLVLAFRDITEALKMQEERAKASRIASLGLLAGGMARDFNNILMGIMGNVSMARVTAQGGAVARPLDEAHQACVRARQLTWQLMTFSKGGVPFKKPVPLPRLLRDAASLALRGTNVSCTFSIAPDLWSVSADEGQLMQVFNNIIVNAQQAMPHGGAIEIRAGNVREPARRFEHALRVEKGAYVRISIVDRGLGIPEEHVGRIFDPYFSTKQAGSGLGLATTYSIVKNHGGYLAVDSKLGRGTTMSVALPASIASEARASKPTGAASGRGRILVMDDEPAIRTLAGNMLKFLGHEVEVVSDGTAAIDRYTRALESGQPFDAVMLDLVVPGGMGAREAIAQLTRVDPMVNAIVVSGYAQDPAMTAFRDYGFKAVIAKPFALEELSSALRSIIATGRSRAH